ncbi:hypothetical protein [Photobacterium sanctipauli]|uniref:hypothetical protein n=1 Tax=Photobacterium sanctipauli TaxID=1342794 RepID=UPI001304A2E0|nr:hypothetical protein [Photobacterium sanctipauli]
MWSFELVVTNLTSVSKGEFQMWKEDEMACSWTCRIARDMPKMPLTMCALFYIADFLVS